MSLIGLPVLVKVQEKVAVFDLITWLIFFKNKFGNMSNSIPPLGYVLFLSN